MKPLHAKWVINLFNQLSSFEGKKWKKGKKASGISDALERGLAAFYGSFVDPITRSIHFIKEKCISTLHQKWIVYLKNMLKKKEHLLLLMIMTIMIIMMMIHKKKMMKRLKTINFSVVFIKQLLFWKKYLLKLLYVYDFFILNSRQKMLLRQVRQFRVLLENLGEQTTKAKILCSFCFHSKMFIVTFIACNFFWKMNPHNIYRSQLFWKWFLATFNVRNFLY